jgi:predicted kinase
VTDSRRLVYVSGAPGSGKTSLAVPLAAELGYTLLIKDRIKETLHNGPVGIGTSSPWTRPSRSRCPRSPRPSAPAAAAEAR